MMGLEDDPASFWGVGRPIFRGELLNFRWVSDLLERFSVTLQLADHTEPPGMNAITPPKFHISYPDAPCREYLPTLGEKWPHSRANVGKYSIHGAFGINTNHIPKNNGSENASPFFKYGYVSGIHVPIIRWS